MLDRFEATLRSNLFQRHVRFSHQPPHTFELCVADCSVNGITEGCGEAGLQPGTRDGDCAHNMRDLDSLRGMVTDECHCLGNFWIVYRQYIRRLPRDNGCRVEDVMTLSGVATLDHLV